MNKVIKEILSYVLIIGVVILVRTYLVTPVRVSGSSMDKTLKNGEIMLLNKFDRIYEREDIIVVNKKVSGNTIIKRIIGIPGETISCKDGVVYLDGKEYTDEYAYGKTSDFKEVKLGKGEYFVLGDNRLVSNDSRYFGVVKEKYIKGKTNFILFPLNKFGKVK